MFAITKENSFHTRSRTPSNKETRWIIVFVTSNYHAFDATVKGDQDTKDLLFRLKTNVYFRTLSYLAKDFLFRFAAFRKIKKRIFIHLHFNVRVVDVRRGKTGERRRNKVSENTFYHLLVNNIPLSSENKFNGA